MFRLPQISKKDFFITATDTGVGKTYVSAQLAHQAARDLSKSGKKVGYFKPFQSGLEQGVLPDADMVSRSNPNIIVKNSYITKLPAAPALSMEADGVEMNLTRVLSDFAELKKQCETVFVEGSGGFLVPVSNTLLMSDVIKALKLPIIIVARPDLGTINHTLLTIEAAKARNIEIAAVIISNYPAETKDPVITTAPKYIEEFSGLKPIILKSG